MSMEARTGTRTGWLTFAAVVMIWFGFASLLIAVLVTYALARNDPEDQGLR
jgi:hypothetical protein